MPHLPEKFGTYPLVLRDFRVENLKLGEILMDYDKYELYYVKRDTGELVSVARDIFNYILALRTQNTFFEIIDATQEEIIINTSNCFNFKLREIAANSFKLCVISNTPFINISK